MKVFVIGSFSSNTYGIKEAYEKFTEMGCEVRYVEKDNSRSFSELINDCFLHIDSWADLVVAVPKRIYPTLEFGDGTIYEMEHARAVGKPVVVYYS